ncbi:peptidase S28, partial [Neoconidiobolus thromboides FSU 785]
YFEQKIDHFNLTSLTFQQRYFINKDYFNKNKENNVGVIYIGGENELKESRVKNGLFYSIIKETGGLLAALEHRYYGKSQPYPTFETKNLAYLSSKQMLYDILDFKNYLKNKYNINHFILTGGSYSANLAVWSKLNFDQDYLAIFASSPPLTLKEDFYEYDQGISKALNNQGCNDKLIKIRQHLDELYQKNSDELENIKTKLNCSPIKDNLLFLYTISDILATIIQYNSNDHLPSIDSFCSSLNKAPINDIQLLLMEYIRQLNLFLEDQNQSCYDFSNYQDLTNTTINPKSYFRQWIYQSCNEFGYWQTAPSNQTSLRSIYLTKEWFNEFYCKNVFKDKPFDLFGNINAYNQQYSFINNKNINELSKNANFTNIILTNGELDPWNKLSLLPDVTKLMNVRNNLMQQVNSDSYIIEIKGASHVSDMDQIHFYDSESVQSTKQFIKNKVTNWI